MIVCKTVNEWHDSSEPAPLQKQVIAQYRSGAAVPVVWEGAAWLVFSTGKVATRMLPKEFIERFYIWTDFGAVLPPPFGF
jgi:hypothetical protein